MTWIYLAAISIIVVNLGIAYVRKGSMTLVDYTSQPNSYGWVTIVLTMSATVVGGGMFIGVGQIGYEAGLIGLFLGIVYLIGFIFIGTASGKIRSLLRESGSNSLVELINSAYGRNVVNIFCIANLFMYCGLIGAQFTALWEFKKFIELNHGLNPLFWVCFFLAFIAIFLYPVVGGLKKDIQTDVLNMALVLVAIVLFFFGFSHESGETYTRLTHNLSQAHLTGSGIPGTTGYGPMFIVGSLLFLTPLFIARMDIWQRIVTAKTDADSKKGFIVAGIISLLAFSFFSLLGMVAYAYGFKNANYASLDVINTLVDKGWIKAVVIGAFFSALLNSADTFINNVGIFATRTFYYEMWNSNEEKEILRKLKLWSVILTVVSILLAFAFKNFVNLLAGSFSIILIFLPTIIGLFEKKWRNRNAAFWSCVISFAIFILFFVGGFIGRKIAFVPSVISSIFIYILIFQSQKKHVKNMAI